MGTRPVNEDDGAAVILKSHKVGDFSDVRWGDNHAVDPFIAKQRNGLSFRLQILVRVHNEEAEPVSFCLVAHTANCLCEERTRKVRTYDAQSLGASGYHAACDRVR